LWGGGKKMFEDKRGKVQKKTGRDRNKALKGALKIPWGGEWRLKPSSQKGRCSRQEKDAKQGDLTKGDLHCKSPSKRGEDSEHGRRESSQSI